MAVPLDLLLELHGGLPRQAPGGPAHTRHALSFVPDLPARPRIVDLGAGSGAQTLDLLEATDGTVVAVDRLPALLAELRARAATAGLDARVTTVVEDMAEPRRDVVFPAWFHLVWSEGAAYAIGFDRALARWRHLLLPGGFIGLSELTWRVPEEARPEAARAFWSDRYPGMRDDAANRAAFEGAGFELTGSFFLPDEAWWAPYYGPLLERLPAFEAAHADDPQGRALAADTRAEIALFRDHGDAYGYAFYVGRMR